LFFAAESLLAEFYGGLIEGLAEEVGLQPKIAWLGLVNAARADEADEVAGALDSHGLEISAEECIGVTSGVTRSGRAEDFMLDAV